MGWIRYCCGETKLSVTGAAPQELLNTLSRNEIPFWDVRFQDELHFNLSLPSKYAINAKELAQKVYCEAEILSECGFWIDARHALRRPILLFGMLAVLFLSFYLQSYVWVVEVDGCDAVPDARLLQVLQELDVHVGAKASSLDMQAVRGRLLNALPELSWVAINRTGGRLCVLACGRADRHEGEEYAAANLIAVRDAVITEQNVSEGMRLCNLGESVKAGQVLVSGFEDYGLCLKAVGASGEIYGQTWYTGTLVMPAVRLEKCYTGRSWTQRTLIVGRKRINLSGNSSFFGILCDKITDTTQLTLPGYRFPLILETAHYREYRLQEEKIPAQEAERSLAQTWNDSLRQSMIAGTVEQTQSTCTENSGLYILRAQSTCHELISRVQPMQLPYEGD